MYTHSTIINCLRGLIGFDQSYNTEVGAIDSDLETSSSGLYVTGLHPLLTYENILAIAEKFATTDVRVWNSGAVYKVDDVVKNVTLFRSIQAGTNHATSDNTFWKPTTLLSAYLRRVYDQSSQRLINQLFTQKKLNEVAKSLLASVSLYEGTGNISGRITRNSRLVGFRISLKHSDIVSALSQIGLQIDTAGTVKIYLYHSSSNDILQTFSLNHTKSITFQWHEVAVNLTETTGHYYLVYKESELPGSAIRKDINFTGRNYCGSCSEGIMNSQLYNKWSKLISIQPFYVNGYTGSNLWDEDQEIYTTDTNWGMNLKMSVQCDVSDTICTNRSVLTNALGQQIIVDLLNEMAYSLRDNQAKGKIAALAATALDNQENGQHGEAKKLVQAITAVGFDFSQMSEVCLPCATKSGARMTSVWGG